MTIDEAIGTIKGEKWICCQEKYLEAMNLITNTMRKYQQIEQIVNAELEEYHPLDRNIYRLALIREVIEDGSNNT